MGKIVDKHRIAEDDSTACMNCMSFNSSKNRCDSTDTTVVITQPHCTCNSFIGRFIFYENEKNGEKD